MIDCVDDPNEQHPIAPNLRPTRSQIRFYHTLCRELGMPYETAAQQLNTVYRTRRKLSVRIEQLELMRNYVKTFRQHKDISDAIFVALGKEIEKERKNIASSPGSKLPESVEMLSNSNNSNLLQLEATDNTLKSKRRHAFFSAVAITIAAITAIFVIITMLFVKK